MSNWQDEAHSTPIQYGWTIATATATAIAPSGDATTPATYVQVISALPFDCEQIEVLISFHSEVSDSGRFWLALGAAASERDVVEGIAYQLDGSSAYKATFPIFLPRGSRVSIKQHMANAAYTPYFSVRVWPRRAGRPMPPTRWRNCYTGPVWAYGSAVTTGLNSYGAWAEAIASTPWPVRFLALNSNSTSGGGTRRQLAYQVGIGAGGAERLLWDMGSTGSAFYSEGGSTGLVVSPVPTLPTGTRFSVAMSDTAGPSSLSFNLIIGG